jgi:CRISP-associated protein Cas1
MHELLNTLYVQTQGAVLHLDSDTVRVTVEGETKLQAPLLRLSAIVVLGQVTVTPFLIHRCATDGRGLVWMTRSGRFMARAQGPVSGNVLLRQAQHRALETPGIPVAIARQIVAAKIRNSRQVLLRSGRDAPDEADRLAFAAEAAKLASTLVRLPETEDLDEIRGAEGDAARSYFGVFGRMLRGDEAACAFGGRSRRPPKDPPNAILSFLYALLCSECASALEGVGLDPQVGYLHALRPGRPALALDLMEELRSVVADRLAITLLNRRQLKADDFQTMPDGGIHLTDDGRRRLVVAYQERKAEEVQHSALKQKLPLGLVPHVQARLLARHLRGDLASYPPFLSR